METAKPPTSQSMLLLPLLLLLCGATIGTALPNRELQMLEMMQSILGVESDFSGRSQRSGQMMFASSVPCDDSLPDESSDNFNLFEPVLDDSYECENCGPPQPLEPCQGPMVPMQHPCYVRVILLRTPLMRHDPCKNFTLAMERTTPAPTTTPTTLATTTTTKPTKRKGKRCKSKKRKGSMGSDVKALGKRKKLTTTTTQETTLTTDKETTAITITTTTAPKTDTTASDGTTSNTASPSTSTSTDIPTTTEQETSTTEETSTSPTTTTTTTTTTAATTTTTTTAPNVTTLSYTKNNQLKSLRGRRRKKFRRLPSVPDKPKIKVDGAMQSSDTHSVFLSSKAAALTSRSMVTTTEPETETTTDCIESSSDEETAAENDESNTNEEPQEYDESEATEDCDEVENQDTNLCPQFTAPEEPANMRQMSTSNRFRKPVKNYVEPILYEGQFAKPRQRIGMLPPQRRDYFVSNKQIMPRPRPKFREPLPPSIYMNNIVRGLKCNDEVAGPRNYPPQPRRFQTVKPTTSQRIWPNRRQGQSYSQVGPQLSQLSPPRSRGIPIYGLGSAEDPDTYGNDSEQYYDDESQELYPWAGDRSPQPSASPPDPCQVALSSRERERDRQSQRERVNGMMGKRERNDRDDREERQMIKKYDYQNQMNRNFFT